MTHPVVFIRLSDRGKRTSGLLIETRADGTAVVYTRGHTFVVPRAAVSRARRSATAHVIGARLRAEYAGIQALAAPLLRRRRRGVL